jgi:superfamily II DNA or RNA helicase
MEVSDFFVYKIKDFPRHGRLKKWDGTIRLFNRKGNKLYIGLITYLAKFCKDRNYKVICEDEELYKTDKVSTGEVLEFLKSLNIPEEINERDYQVDSIAYLLTKKRAALLSPTSSGKTFMAYVVQKYINEKTLLIVPTLSLLYQMRDDFVKYGSTEDVHIIKSGEEKNSNARIIISTWQSIHELDEEWFNQFDVIFADECHQYKAKCLKSIMEKSTNVAYRFGVTGTIDDEDTDVNRLLVEGLFGKVKRFITTRELIDQGHACEIKINVVTFNHSLSDCMEAKNKDWQQEIEFISGHEKRNEFIVNLATKLDNNVMILYQRIEKHGDILYAMLQKKTNKPIFYINGKTPAEDREQVRKIAETHNNAIILASYGTFSTGVSINNLHHLIFASPFKGLVRNLQSIGRMLRLHDSKDFATLWDLADDFRPTPDSKTNTTLEWLGKRIVRYIKEKFPYNQKRIKL